jgi:hypothetical protein
VVGKWGNSMDFIAGLLLGGVSRFAGRGGHGGRAISREHLGHGVPKNPKISRENTDCFLCSMFGIVLTYVYISLTLINYI